MIRIDSEQSANTSHTEDLDKQVAKISAQLKHVMKTTATLEHASKAIKKENKENNIGVITGAGSSANAVNAKKEDVSTSVIPDTCKACEQSQSRFVALEETILRYGMVWYVVLSSFHIFGYMILHTLSLSLSTQSNIL